MAWPFQLSVECGKNVTAAEMVKKHFNGSSFTVNDRIPARFMVDCCSPDENGCWWVSVLVMIGERGLQFGDDPELLKQAAQKLYEKLRGITGYRFAVVGIDTFQFNKAEALPELVGTSKLAGLVVDEKLLRRLGKPKRFVQFSCGYYWAPTEYKFV